MMGLWWSDTGKQRSAVSADFERAQVVERLMAEGAGTASDIRRVAVMFVDFRSFTAGAFAIPGGLTNRTAPCSG